MDSSFNGWRYSATLDCLVDDSGEIMRMCHGSTQIFLLLSQNMNKLVTREHLLREVPSDGTGSGNSLNECIDEIRQVVSDDRLKVIPRVGYLLTPDTTTGEDTKTGEYLKLSKTHTATAGDRVRRPLPALVQELVFNSQWFISGYQRSPHAWIGTFVLVTLLLLSSVGTSASTTMGHVAYDRADSNVCSNRFDNCASCIPGLWQMSARNARSNWIYSTGCSTR